MPAIIIVACLALIGWLVHEKVDGAAVAGVAAITTLIAWVTRVPDKGSGPSLVPLVAAGALIASTSGCGFLHAQKVEAEAAYLAEHMRCVDAEPALPKDATVEQRRAANERVDACRRDVRQRWQIQDAQAARTAPRPPEAGR